MFFFLIYSELQDTLEANEKLKDINQNQSKEAQIEVSLPVFHHYLSEFF